MCRPISFRLSRLNDATTLSSRECTLPCHRRTVRGGARVSKGNRLRDVIVYLVSTIDRMYMPLQRNRSESWRDLKSMLGTASLFLGRVLPGLWRS